MTQPTAQEQQMLELINRMRQAPAAELNLLINSGDANVASALSFFNVNINTLTQQWNTLSPTAPLAWSSQLSDAAIGHNQKMITANEQSHQVLSLNEPALGQRATNALYTGWSNLGENVFAYSKSVFYGHAGFAIDWGSGPGGIQAPAGHRENMMNPLYREVGIGITPSTGTGSGATTGPLVITEDFGTRFALSGKAWLLGVAFRDLDADQFYDPGEGLSGITVQITKANTATPITTTTLDAGGYQALLDPGQYQLNFLQNSLLLKSESITIDATTPVNVKRDLVLQPLLPSHIKKDFNGDNTSDVLWRNTNGAVSVWQMNSNTIQNAAIAGTAGTDWAIQKAADFNGDGKSDILWRNTNGATSIWQMNGSTVQNISNLGTVTSDWTIQNAADFNGDRTSDILWRNTNGAMVVWRMANGQVQSTAVVGTVTNDWVFQDAGDFNGDGKSDILWRNTNGAVVVWQMNDNQVQNTAIVGNVTNDWMIKGVDDFTGDGKSDILWQNTNGAVSIWQMNGGQAQNTTVVGNLTSDWQISGSGDYNANGVADILLRNTNGAAGIWQINNGLLVGSSVIGTVDNSWQVAVI
jgi:uncharacterized protein YkwD